MRIVVDINHPAHVHYFKNYIWEMSSQGHEILITASDKDISFKLLDLYGFDYVNLGTYGRSLFEKVLKIPLLDFRMYLAVKDFKPDIFLGAGSIRAAHTARLLKKPSIILENTEVSGEQIFMYAPFADAILTPSSFLKNLRQEQNPIQQPPSNGLLTSGLLYA